MLCPPHLVHCNASVCGWRRCSSGLWGGRATGHWDRCWVSVWPETGCCWRLTRQAPTGGTEIDWWVTWVWFIINLVNSRLNLKQFGLQSHVYYPKFVKWTCNCGELLISNFSVFPTWNLFFHFFCVQVTNWDNSFCNWSSIEQACRTRQQGDRAAM